MKVGSVEYFVRSYLNKLSDAWKQIPTKSLRSTQQSALQSLVAAGLVKRRAELRLYALGLPGRLEATIEFTGEPGFWKAAESVAWAAKMEFPAWNNAVEMAIAQGSREAEHRMRIEFGDVDQYRLTAEGMLAKDDQDAGSSRPTEFAMAIQNSPDERVEGDGRVVRVEVMNGQSSTGERIAHHCFCRTSPSVASGASLRGGKWSW